MPISRRNNRALNRVLRDSLRARPRSEPPPQEGAKTGAPAYTLCADIPECYNDSYVRAIPKDPRNAFVYWELPDGGADGSLFADKGTAHVGNDEAVRIGEQLNENQRRRQADNGRGADSGGSQADAGYHQINWDGGNQYGAGDYRRADVCQRPRNQHAGNQYYWNDGEQYSRDGIYQQHPNNQHVDNQYHWNDGEQYSRGGGDYGAPRGGNDGAAFSEMLSALIARCSQYIADCRQSGGGPPDDRALSSGLLHGVGEEPRK